MNGGSLGSRSRVMALGTIASRATGFLRSTSVAAALGVAAVGNAYATAYTLPLIVYELLIGGVLTSTLVPILVRAQREDADGGARFERNLAATIGLSLAALLVLGLVFAPQIVSLYGVTDEATAELTVALTRLMLPCVFGYGLTAVFGAILNTHDVYGPQMWAPVLNNIMIISGLALFAALPGPDAPTPESITTTQVLVLGLGPVVGIVAQTVVLYITLRRRAGFRWLLVPDPRHARLNQVLAMASWMVVYVLATQVGNATMISVLNRAGSEGGPGYATWTLSQTVWQLPYAIVGVTLITAILPRMSRSAAAGRMGEVAADLSEISRLTAVVLMLSGAWFVALGPDIATVLFAYGNTDLDDARAIGRVLAVTAVGLVPFAINMFQIRAFYAMQESRPPATVNVLMQGLRSVLNVLASLAAATVVIYLAAVSFSVSLLVGVLVSGLLLRRRLPSQDTARLLRLLARLLVAAAAVVGVAVLVAAGIDQLLEPGNLRSFVVLLVAVPISGVVFLGVCLVLRVTEVRDVLSMVLGRFLPRALRPRGDA